MKITLAIIAALFAVAGNVPYIKNILEEKIRPHPYTWFVWSIVSGVTFFGQVSKGAGVAAIAFGASEIFTIIIFFLSIKYGFKDIPRRDIYFLIAALLGIVPWIVLNDATWSVVIMVAIDLVAFVPTLQKTWRKPGSESAILYTSNVFRHSLALLALSSYNVATMLHSISMIVTNTTMTVFILRGKNPNKFKL